MSPNSFYGMRVIESYFCEQDGEPVTVRRTWRQRMLSRPWRPWVATLTYIPRVPAAYQINGALLIHPTLLKQLRRQEPPATFPCGARQGEGA